MIIKASASITLTRVDDGDDGKGIKSIVNKYLASSSGSNVTTATSGWTNTIQTITTSKRYLWNYEIITYTDNTTTTTTPVIIGVYGNTGSTGATGNGISSITEYYLVSPNKSGVTTSTSGWSTTIPTMTATNKYLWNYEVIKYTNSTTSTGTPKVIGIYGDKGDKGDKGETGVGISSVDVEYYLSTSSTAQSGGSWSTTAPTWANGKYMWSRTKTVTTAGKTTYSNPVCITGGKGSTGATGATGKGVSSITEEYYLSTSKTTQNGGSWTTTPPTWSSGKYVWTRSKIVYSNPTSTVYTTPICDSSWEAVNEIQVGGTNMALDTNKGITGWGWAMLTGGKTISEVTENGIRCCKLVRDSVASTGWSYIYYSNSKISREKYLPNKQYTVSFEVKASVATKFGISIQRGDAKYPLTKNVSTETCIANTWTKLSATLTTLSTLPTDTSQILYFHGVNSNTGVSYIFRNLKIEEGNKATAWTPAPKDVDSAITNVDNKVTTTNNKVAEIVTNLDGITQRVSSTESTVSTHTTQLGTVDSRINTAKNSAISTAASDATSKANNAQNKALADAKSYTNGQITTVNKTITDKVAEIKTTIDSITQRVSSAETKVNTVTTNFNNLQIGGRNLILNSALNGNKNWIGATVDTSKKYGNCNSLKFTGSASAYSSSTPAKVGEVFTVSVKSFVGTSGGNLPLIIFEEYKDNTTTRINYQETTVPSTINSWQTYKATWTVKKSETTNVRIRIYNRTASYNFWVSQPKLEKGNKATDWTPAPEDVDSAITSVDSKVTATNNKVATIETNLNSITSKVSSAEKNITTINGNITSLQNRMSSAESKITSSAIINTVQSTINTAKNEAISSANTNTANQLKNYATTSSLTQTADSITAKFSSSGGYNIVKNGGFKNSSSGWNEAGHNPNGTSRSSSIWNDSSEWVLDGTYALCMRSTNNTSGEFRVDSQKFKVKRNTTYTLSYLVSAHRVTKIGHYIRGNEWGIIDSRGYSPAGGGKNRNNWTRVVNTFNTGDNYQISINFIHFVTGSDAYSWITDVIINEGGVALPWTPHPSEVYEGSTVIDGSGVTVKNGALKVENNAGTTVLQGNTSGTLYLKDGGLVVAGTATDVWNNYGYRTTLKKNGIQFNWDASDSGSGSPPVSANVYLDYSRGQLVLSGGTKAPGIYVASGLEASSITTPGSIDAAAESRFSDGGTYSDPWNGTACAIKASGHIATTGDLRANGAINANGGININSGNLVLGKANTEQQIYFSDCSSDNRNMYFYKGGSSSATRVGLYDKEAGSAVWRYANDNTFVLERQLIVKGHVVPHTTRAYWIGTNSPDKKWKGLCAEGGTVGASDIRNKENIERLDGTIVTYDEVSEEINEYQLYNLRSTARASARDYYEFIKDRFKPSYYNYKLSEVVNEETGEYTIDPADEYDMLKNVGFIAQDYDLETDSVAREFIFQNESGEYSYNHMSYVTVGMIALQEATKKIESLENSNAELLNKNKELEDRLKILEDLIMSK